MTIPPFKRAIVIVVDSVGVGELPDAAAYGDQGSDTLGNIAKRVPLKLPTLRALGLERIAAIGNGACGGSSTLAPAAVGRMQETSPGKDSVTGHWEMMGIVLAKPFPVFPHGFPAGHHRGVFTSDRTGGSRAISPPPVRRSSKSWARNTCGRAR